MVTFKYGRGEGRFFSILTPLSGICTGIIAKLYCNYAKLNYKDYSRLCISCDKGPEICEGELLQAVNVDTKEKVLFNVIKIRHHTDADIWTLELEEIILGKRPLPKQQCF